MCNRGGGVNVDEKTCFDKDDLVNYIINQYKQKTSADISPLKLQKSLYLLFAMWGGNVAIINKDIDKGQGTIELTDKVPTLLFDANFEAWEYGPVDIDVYDRYKENEYQGDIQSITDLTTVSQDLSNVLMPFINSVLQQVFDINDFSLVSITQEDKVWKSAYEDSKNLVMNNEDIIKEYKEKLGKRRIYDKRRNTSSSGQRHII